MQRLLTLALAALALSACSTLTTGPLPPTSLPSPSPFPSASILQGISLAGIGVSPAQAAGCAGNTIGWDLPVDRAVYYLVNTAQADRAFHTVSDILAPGPYIVFVFYGSFPPMETVVVNGVTPSAFASGATASFRYGVVPLTALIGPTRWALCSDATPAIGDSTGTADLGVLGRAESLPVDLVRMHPTAGEAVSPDSAGR